MSLEGLATLLCIALGLLVWAAWLGWQALRSARTLATELRRAEAAGKEQAARLAALEALRDQQLRAEHALASSAAVVKEVHKGIADIPFSVLEAIPAARTPARALRGLHDAISDGVYGALGNLNKAVGRELRKAATLSDQPPLPDAPREPESTSILPDTPEAEPPDDEPPPGAGKRSWG